MSVGRLFKSNSYGLARAGLKRKPLTTNEGSHETSGSVDSSVSFTPLLVWERANETEILIL